MDDLTGTHLRGYELRERIGEGGFGVVYRAYQAAVKRDVVIKAILPVYANNPDFIRSFEAEAQLIARLEHLHIVPLYDYWRGPEGAFLVMRWMRGGSLLDTLTAGPWDLLSTVRILDQIASALTLAHHKNVIHQDIKPANILLDEGQNAYLTDFGLAKDLEGGLDLAVSSLNASVRGSPAYISPEQIKRTAISPQTDMYSLGIVLFEMLCGVHPFGMTNMVEMLRHQLNSQLPAIQTYRPDLPDKINLVLWRATAKDPDIRYHSMIKMTEAFHEAVADYDIHTQAASPYGSQYPALVPTTTGVISLASLEALLPTSINPFKGLRAFQEADAADFFGREKLVDTLLARLSETTEGSRFLAVVGPSGSGKSSVVKAGLIPALRQGRLAPWQKWFIVEMTPGSNPLFELENALMKVSTSPDNSVSQTLAAENGLHDALTASLPSSDSELVLVMDQFEEIFTQVTNEETRAHFLNILCQAVTTVDSRLRLIVTLRADFYDRPLTYAGIGQLLRDHTEVVLPLSSAELANAITAPARRAGLELETGLTDRIIADVIEQPNALPLLQFTLSELYEQRRKDRLTLDSYTTIGGVSGALVRRADELYNQLDSRQRMIVPQIFLRLVALGEGVEDTRRRALQSELTALSSNETDAAEVIEQFGRYRLLSFDRDPATRAPTVEIAHEALIRNWQTLRDWIENNRNAVRLHRQLSTAAADWTGSNRDSSFLASGARLEQFETLQQSAVIVFNDQERTYLQASIQRRQRAAQTRQVIVSLIACTALVIALLALIALDQRNRAAQASEIALAAQSTAVAERDRANQEALIARSRELAASAMASQNRIDLALLLSLGAVDTADTFEARDGLLTLLQLHPRLIRSLPGHTDTVRSVAYSPDGTALASGSRDGTVRIWSLTAPHNRVVLQGHTGWVNAVAYSPDNRWLASADNNGTIILWNLLTSPPEQTVLEASQVAVWSLTFSPDSQKLASAGADNMIHLWNVSTGERSASGVGHQDIVYSLAFHPDGDLLASGSADGSIRLWDSDTLEPLNVFTGHTNWVFDVDFSPDGQLLVSGSADNSLRVWQLATGESQALRGHANWVRSVKFMPDSAGIVSGGTDGLILIWNLQSGMPVDGFTNVGSQAIWSIDLFENENGSQIASAGTDNNLYIWNQNPAPALGEIIEIRDEQIAAIAINHEGTLLANAGGVRNDFAITLRSIQDGTQIQSLMGHQDQVTSLAFHPTLPLLASGSLDRRVIVWNTQSGEMLRSLTVPASVFAVTFRPDGKQLAIGDTLGQISLWNTNNSFENWQPVEQPLNGHTDRVVSLVYQQDSAFLLSGSRDSTIRMWDSDTGSALGEPLTAHADGILSLALSPDGRLLASASRDTTIGLWVLRNGRWEPTGSHLTGHSNWVVDVRFSPDSRILASAGGDQTILLWDVEQRSVLGRPFVGHTDWVNALAFEPNGNHLYSVGRDGRLIAWSTGPDLWRERACQIANRTLTPDEQQRYLRSTTALNLCSDSHQEQN